MWKTREKPSETKVVPRGLEPRTLRLLAVRSNQLSYETLVKNQAYGDMNCFASAGLRPHSADRYITRPAARCASKHKKTLKVFQVVRRIGEGGTTFIVRVCKEL